MFTQRVLPALAACAALAGMASPASAAPGEAPFTPAPDVTLPGAARPEAVAIGDFDNDGRQDLAVADPARSRVAIRIGGGDGTFAGVREITGLGEAGTVVVADFNNDGNEDLAVGGRTLPFNSVSVLVGNGKGEFTPGTVVFLPDKVTRHLATGDFNGDGRTDLVAATAEHVAVRIVAPDGKFSGGADMPYPAPGDPKRVATGDFDGDGFEDLIFPTAGLTAGRLNILAGVGNGAFGPTRSATLPDPALAVAVGDLDGDARQDVVAPIPGKDTVGVRLGNGSGTLPAGGPPQVPVGDGPSAIAIGDFDADGREDLVTANEPGRTLSVRLGDGTGRFTGGGDLEVGGTPVAVAVGDFNSDGRGDLVSANGAAGTLSVRLGAGDVPLAGNLLTNGGFEQAPGVRRPDAVAPIPGWTTVGGMTAVRYGTSPAVGFLGWLDAPRYQTGGSHFLWGGKSTDGTTTATQTVDVTGSARSIDRGRATIGLSAWLGGTQLYLDSMAVLADFLDAGGASKGSLRLQPPDRRGLTTLMRVAGQAAVPAGTRQIAVTLTSRDADTVSSAMADNVKLTLDAPGNEPEPSPGGQPGPGGEPGPGGGGPDGPWGGPDADREAPVIGRVARRRSRIRFTLSEPAAVTLRIERAGKGRRKRAVATLRRTGRAGVNRVAFSGRIGRRKLRPGSYRVVITAVDAAGNRSVAKARRFQILR